VAGCSDEGDGASEVAVGEVNSFEDEKEVEDASSESNDDGAPDAGGLKGDGGGGDEKKRF
jgi:hypothetical protein